MGSFYISIFLLVILVQDCYGCKTKITNNEEELGVFAKCQNKWCLQRGLQKLQYTKCESVENKGKTCINPEIKYGATIVGLPIVQYMNQKLFIMENGVGNQVVGMLIILLEEGQVIFQRDVLDMIVLMILGIGAIIIFSTNHLLIIQHLMTLLLASLATELQTIVKSQTM